MLPILHEKLVGYEYVYNFLFFFVRILGLSRVVGLLVVM